MMCDRDGTIALLDQMVGTTTKATARAVATPSVNPAAQAAILAAAAVAQVRYPLSPFAFGSVGTHPYRMECTGHVHKLWCNFSLFIHYLL